VLRLIGHYQAGREPTPELAFRPAPLPKFEGTPPASVVQPPPGPPPSAILPQHSGAGPIRVPPLTPDKVTQYAGLFEKSGAQNGILPADQAKQIFERAGLPNEILGRIWGLADVEQRGALNVTEFTIAMHLLASFKTGQLRALPAVLPPGLYDAASRRPASRQVTGPPPPLQPAMTGIARQFTGQSAQGRGSPLGRSTFGPPPPQIAQTTGSDWLITPMDKQRFDSIYAGLDRGNKGYITGDEAVPFFSESKLPEEVLAQIWDLADINSEGHLNRDEFAVAMHLIRQQRSKSDGRDTLPATLPLNLIPPSMRNQVRPPTQPTAPDFDVGVPSMPKSAADDLFGLDALSASPPPAPAAAQVPLPTGGSTSLSADPFGNPHGPVSPTQSPLPLPPSNFKPFIPSSSFGQALTYNATGGSNSSAPQQSRDLPVQKQPSAMDDLLGDNDPVVSSKLTTETTELGNLSNQIGTLSNQMQEVQGQRATSQNELNQAGSQKRDFELRLAQLRSLYEQEVKDVNALKERLAASRSETAKLQQEMAMIEGTYQDLRTQHQQVATALQADQQENANLKERIRAVNAEIAQMKPQLEKLRSEARQQKGLVAINKKQLATNEGERDKLKTEAADLNKSIEEDTRILAETQSRVQSPVANVASPAPSSMSATNPFFRSSGGGSEPATSPFAQSPETQQPLDRSFDSVFGPAFTASSNGAPPMPPTSFKQETADISGLPESHTASNTHTPSTSPPPVADQDTLKGVESQPTSEPTHANTSFLPFPSDRANSLTSSQHVSASQSRQGEESGFVTPLNFPESTPTGSSTGGVNEEVRSGSPNLERNAATSPQGTDAIARGHDAIPGAFPGDVNSHITATPTGGSTVSEQAAGKAIDPFAGTEPLTSAKDDFDSAFDSFGETRKPQERQNTGDSLGGFSVTGAPKPANTEFPPIAELDNDDDSDSDSDGAGFDDDFTSASPTGVKKTGAVEHVEHSTTAPEASTSEPPPAAEATPAPPSYDQTVSPTDDKAPSDTQHFDGLLPSREDPTSDETLAEQTFASKEPSNGGQSLFGANQGGTLTQPVPPPKTPFDDFDDEFDDLEEAKEADVDDDIVNHALDRSGIDEFNPTFESPAAPKTGDVPHTSSGFGDLGSSTTSAQGATSTSGLPAQDNHDWDAIFAGLDKAPAAGATDTTFPSIDEGTPAKENGNGSAEKPERPPIGRALTEAGEHDDPILKSLTSIGYPREEALAALEKYDYNLERVSTLNKYN
jgi:epidermal growth factor receptor substrate 15